PVIACDCAACASDDPRDRRTRTGAAIAWTDPAGAERVALLDATPDLRQQALRHDLRRCDAIFFTHHHVDHIFGLDEVRRFNAVMRAPIDVFADAHTLESLRRVYKHVFDARANVNKSFVATLLPRQVRALESVSLHGLRFTPIPLLHGRLPILGWRVDAESAATRADWLPLAYCTDVSAVPPEAWPALDGVRTLVLDALRRRKHPTHLSIDEAVSIAQRVAADRTLFVHMGHEVVHAEVDPTLPEGVSLAYDGLTLGDDATPRPPDPDRRPGPA
ncbi:MAG: MBL fold metallo-hydrolase, partial [Planctomycetota bacterium]